MMDAESEDLDRFFQSTTKFYTQEGFNRLWGEMREMLIKHEWNGAYDDNDSGCPECIMPRGNIDNKPRHKTGCALAALLEKIR